MLKLALDSIKGVDECMGDVCVWGLEIDITDCVELKPKYSDLKK